MFSSFFLPPVSGQHLIFTFLHIYLQYIFLCLTGWTAFIYTLSGSIHVGESSSWSQNREAHCIPTFEPRDTLFLSWIHKGHCLSLFGLKQLYGNYIFCSFWCPLWTNVVWALLIHVVKILIWLECVFLSFIYAFVSLLWCLCNSHGPRRYVFGLFFLLSVSFLWMWYLKKAFREFLQNLVQMSSMTERWTG